LLYGRVGLGSVWPLTEGNRIVSCLFTRTFPMPRTVKKERAGRGCGQNFGVSVLKLLLWGESQAWCLATHTQAGPRGRCTLVFVRGSPKRSVRMLIPYALPIPSSPWTLVSPHLAVTNIITFPFLLVKACISALAHVMGI
jgi:hypothetical protein